MDLTPSTLPTMGPPMLSGPAGDRNMASQEQNTNGDAEGKAVNNGGISAPVGAAAAAQQPKVVQTAFIHKLYKWAHFHPTFSTVNLIRMQHARGSKHPAPHFLVEYQRKFCHVPFKRLLQGLVVCISRALTSLIYLTRFPDRTSNTLIFPHSSAN